MRQDSRKELGRSGVGFPDLKREEDSARWRLSFDDDFKPGSLLDTCFRVAKSASRAAHDATYCYHCTAFAYLEVCAAC